MKDQFIGLDLHYNLKGRSFLQNEILDTIFFIL